MERIGIMGGTFDPIHYAHLILGEQALAQLHLDKILFIPTGEPPHKSDKQVTAANHRLAMTKLAIENNACFMVSDLEITMEGTTYTAKTLRKLKELYPDAHLYFIMGGDSLAYLDKWYQPEEIFALSTIVATVRDEVDISKVEQLANQLTAKFNGEIRLLSIPAMDISSNFLRIQIAKGQSVRYYIPDEVYQYISEHQLYQC